MEEQKSAQELFREAVEWYNSLPKEEQEKIKADINERYESAEARHAASNLLWDRFLASKEYDGYVCGQGDYYVYMWKHIDGTPFYIGSGHGYRWKSHNNNARTREFIREVDKNDAILYKIGVGLEEKEAREIEFCCIHNLTFEGFDLAQITYNYQRLPSEKRMALQRKKYEKLLKETKAQFVIDRMRSLMFSEADRFDMDRILKFYEQKKEASA